MAASPTTRENEKIPAASMLLAPPPAMSFRVRVMASNVPLRDSMAHKHGDGHDQHDADRDRQHERVLHDRPGVDVGDEQMGVPGASLGRRCVSS